MPRARWYHSNRIEANWLNATHGAHHHCGIIICHYQGEKWVYTQRRASESNSTACEHVEEEWGRTGCAFRETLNLNYQRARICGRVDNIIWIVFLCCWRLYMHNNNWCLLRATPCDWPFLYTLCMLLAIPFSQVLRSKKDLSCAFDYRLHIFF